MRQNVPQVNFASGEIVTEADERADSQIFARAVRRLDNGIITPLGQIRRRPGFGYQADLTTALGASSPNVRMETYIFSSSQFYVLVFEPGKCSILSVNGTLIQSFSTSPITKITAARLWEFHLCYRGDSIILTHEAFWPIEIKRTSATTFTCGDFPFYKEDSLSGWQSTASDPSYRYAPFYLYYAPRTSPLGAGVMLTMSAASGAITLTSSVDYFLPGHVGAILGFEGSVPGSGEYTWMPKFSEGMVITGYTSPTSVTAQTLGASSSGDLTIEKTQWGELMWNDARGYPRTACFHEQRLFFAGSPGHPNAIWGSASASFSKQGKADGAYYDFAWMAWTGSPATPVETDPLLMFVADDQVLDIRRLHSYRNLHIMTTTAEFIVPSSLTDSAITPFNFRARKQTPYGVDDQVAPVVYDDAVVFLERSRKVLREVVYNDLQKAYGAQSLSNLAPHRINDPKQMCLWKGSATTPEAMLFLLSNDGTISVMQGNRGNDTLGWHRWTTPGKFLSIAAIYEYVFALVEREIDGVARVYLERMDEASILDCMLEFDLPNPTDQLPGQERLAGNRVAVMIPRDLPRNPPPRTGAEADEIYVHVASVEPVAGQLDLPILVQSGHTGLDAGFFVELLSPAPIVRGGIAVAQPKAVGRIGVGVEHAASLLVDGQERGPYKPAMLPDDLQFVASGNVPAMGTSVGRRLHTQISQSRPGKLTLLSVTRDVVF